MSSATKSTELLWSAESSHTIRDLMETFRDIIQDNARRKVISEHRREVTTDDVEASLEVSIRDLHEMIRESMGRGDARR